MQGLVTLDFGNTNPHAGLFQKHQNTWQLIKTVPWNELAVHLHGLQMNPHNTTIVLCEVKEREEELRPYLEQGYLLTRLKDYWRGTKFAGMPVSYAKTLGEDRLINAFYLFKTLKQNVLVIDAGTFVTMDVVTTAGFQGGYIIPGTNHYFSLYQKGELLKDAQLDQTFSQHLPQGTAEAMRDSYLAFAALAQKIIQEQSIEKVVLTGGQGELWKNIFDGLQSSVIVQVEKDLLHLSLHYWMTTQIEVL